MLENSREKLKKKNIDMICANSLKQEGAGFGTDTNIVTMISKDEEVQLPVLSKDDTAFRILSKIIENMK